LPYLVRTVGLENYGLISFSLSLALYFGAVIQYGFGITATREIARNRDDLNKVSLIYSSTVVASFLLAIICLLVFFLLILFVDLFRSNMNLYLYTIAFVVFQSAFPIWFFQGMERMKYIAFLSLSANLLFLISLVFFVREQHHYVIVPLLNAVASFLILCISFFLIGRQFKVRFFLPSFQEIKLVYSNGSHAFISQLAPNLYNNSAVFLIGVFENNTVVGIYAAATKVIDAVISFAYILSKTFLPYLSRNLNKHKIFQKIMLLSGLSLSIAIYATAELITSILFGVDNYEISTYIKILSVTVLFSFGYLTYHSNYLMITGNENIAKNISIYVSLAAFCWTLFLVYFLGVFGGVISLLLSRFLLSLFSFVYYKKVSN